MRRFAGYAALLAMAVAMAASPAGAVMQREDGCGCTEPCRPFDKPPGSAERRVSLAQAKPCLPDMEGGLGREFCPLMPPWKASRRMPGASA